MGILTSTGSFSSVIPPFLDQKSSVNISWKLPRGGSRWNWERTGCEIFAYHDKNELIFLYTNAKNRAVKFNIDKSIHRKISSSATPNEWHGYPVGVRINKFFWMFGGTAETYRTSYYNETLLWSFKKQRWFRGPDLPTEIAKAGGQMICATAVNFSTVFIFKSEYPAYTSSFSFHFKRKVWKQHKDPPNGFHGFLSCTLYLTKTYERLKSVKIFIILQCFLLSTIAFNIIFNIGKCFL